MSRISRLTEELRKLKEDSIIVEFAHMQPNWLIVLSPKHDLYLTNKETQAFIEGAKAQYMYGR